MAGIGYLAAALVLIAAGAGAQTAVPIESGTQGSVGITLHVHPFLAPEELSALRLVLTNEQALDLFVPKGSGFAALAVSPEDGFIRDGALAASAQALGELPDAGAARAAATSACDALRKGASPCVVVLEIAPQ